MTPTQINQYRDAAREASERAAKATPGPWEAWATYDDLGDSPVASFLPPGLYEKYTQDQSETDSDFIAAARDDVPTLADGLNAALDELERVRKDAAREIEAAFKEGGLKGAAYVRGEHGEDMDDAYALSQAKRAAQRIASGEDAQ